MKENVGEFEMKMLRNQRKALEKTEKIAKNLIKNIENKLMRQKHGNTRNKNNKKSRIRRIRDSKNKQNRRIKNRINNS